jgi:hypothetical protein
MCARIICRPVGVSGLGGRKSREEGDMKRKTAATWLVAILVMCPAAVALASEEFAGFYWRIWPQHCPSACLEVDPTHPANGGGVHLRQRVSEYSMTEQMGMYGEWAVIHVHNGYYKLINRYSGLCLDVDTTDESGMGNGSDVQQWAYLGGDNQLWRIEEASPGYKITNKLSGKVLDASGAGCSSATAVHQWEWRGEANQIWRFEATQADGSSEVFERSLRVASHRSGYRNPNCYSYNSGDCLDAECGLDCVSVYHDIDLRYVMTGIGLTVVKGGYDNAEVSRLWIESRRLAEGQPLGPPFDWTVEQEGGDPQGELEAWGRVPDGHVIVGVGAAVYGNSVDTLRIASRKLNTATMKLEGDILYQYFGDIPYEQWDNELTLLDENSCDLSSVNWCNTADVDRAVITGIGFNATGTPETGFPDYYDDTQRIETILARISILRTPDLLGGVNLAQKPDAQAPGEAGGSLLGDLSQHGDFMIVSKSSGKCLDVSGEGTHNGANVHLWEPLSKANQLWRFEDAGGGFAKIVNINSGLCLEVSGNDSGAKADGSNVRQWEYVGGWNQQWQLVQEGDYYRIISRRSGMCLDADATSHGGNSNGTNVHQWSCPGLGDNQLWEIRATSPW